MLSRPIHTFKNVSGSAQLSKKVVIAVFVTPVLQTSQEITKNHTQPWMYDLLPILWDSYTRFECGDRIYRGCVERAAVQCVKKKITNGVKKKSKIETDGIRSLTL